MAGEAAGQGEVWREPDRRSECLRYAVSCCVVLAVLASLGRVMASQPPGPLSLEADDAVMVDLMPAPPSSLPRQEADDGPERQASEATPVEPPAAQHPPEEAPPPEAPKGELQKPESQPVEAPPPPPAPAQQETAPSGAEAPVADAPPEVSEESRRAAARAVSLWQRAMAKRLEATKQRLGHPVRAGGAAVVAFTIDRSGRLVTSRIATSSGSAAADAVALRLVAEASPFPVPPEALSEAALSFSVPVRFTSRQPAGGP